MSKTDDLIAEVIKLNFEIADLKKEKTHLREALQKICKQNIGCWSGDEDAPEQIDSCDKMVQIAEQALKE